MLPVRFNLIDVSADVMRSEILSPFAFEEVYGNQVGHHLLPPAVHIWRHHKAFVVGSRDRKLPYFSTAVNWLKQQGYHVAVRNSGGTAVPLDCGVVNISVILPLSQGDLGVDRPFQLMSSLLAGTLQRSDSLMRIGEIAGAYCPGEYDLSILGKKFCGISQRRQVRAVVVQSFVLVEGDGKERGQLVKSFYNIAAGGSFKTDYPCVQPECMASLAQLIGVRTSEEYINGLKAYLACFSEPVMYQDYSLVSQQEVSKAMQTLQTRLRQTANHQYVARTSETTAK